jgi:hypothetical protein
MRKARIAVVTVLPRRYPLALLGAPPLWLGVRSLDVARAQAPMRPLRTSRPRNEGRFGSPSLCSSPCFGCGFSFPPSPSKRDRKIPRL